MTDKIPLLKNLIILMLAPVLAWGLFLATRDLSGLSASVLDILEVQTIQKHGRGLAYKHQSQIFEVFGSEKVKDAESLVFQILYDPLHLQIDLATIRAQDYQILEQGTGLLQIRLDKLADRQVDEGWFEVGFSGAAEDILLEYAQARRQGQMELQSIGNLSQSTQSDHSLTP